MTGQHYNTCFWDHVQLLCGLAFYGKLNEPPKLSGGFSRFEASKPAKHNVVSFFLVSWGGSAGFWCFFFAWTHAFLYPAQWTSSQLMKNIHFNMGCWAAYLEHLNISTWNLPCFAGRQTAMFSATFGTGVQHLAADFLDSYTFVAVGRVGSAAQTVEQRLLWVEDRGKKVSGASEISESTHRNEFTVYTPWN